VLISKSWFFGERYIDCLSCWGTKRAQCTACKKGKVQTLCPTCGGTGGEKDCQMCNGRRKIACSTCEGKGTIPPNWSKERINAEIAQRRLQMAEEQRALNYWHEECKRNQSLYDQGFPGRGNERAIARLNEELFELMSWLK
jgi:hypothetical protein